MVRRCLAYATVAGLSAAVMLSPANADNVIELFTSQGCSSCPPADALLGKLAAEPNTVAISFAIDVWDYLGWKDTLADPRNTARWKAYSKARGDRQVYTPQAVVNGVAHAVGSDRHAIDKAVVKTRHNPHVMTVPLKLDGHRLSIGQADIGTGAEIFLLGLTRTVTVAIGRGENKGKTIAYFNVVRSMERFDGWNGKPGSFTLPPSKTEGVDATAVFVQTNIDGLPGPILGAAIASLR